MNNNILIREYKQEDTQALAAIYYHTIHNINIRNYTEEQVNAWAPYGSVEDYSGWQKKLDKTKPFVAEIDGVIVGFAEFEHITDQGGHIDCFYVHHEFQGKDIGSALITAIFDKAATQNISRIFAEVSITAKPFFEAKDFQVVKEQTVKMHGVEMINFVIERLS